MHRLEARLAWFLPPLLLAASCLGLAQKGPSLTQEPSNAEPAHNYVPAPRNLIRDLNAHGISLQAMLVFDWSKSLAGNDATLGFGRYSLDVMMPVDGKAAFGLDGISGLVRLKHHLQAFGETYDDEAQIYSNIDAPSRTTLYEAWLQKSFFSERIRLKAGKMDANTEFAADSTAADFLNSSMGFSPTILSFPTYPEPKAGINIFLGRPGAAYLLGGGVFRAAEGTMWILEPTRNWNLGPNEAGGRASVGYWRLGGKTGLLDGGDSRGTNGFYSLLEQSVWRSPTTAARSLSGFIQFGWADGRSSRITEHVGGGVVVRGPWSVGSHDSAGAAATWVRFSRVWEDSEPGGELTLELYYKLAFNQHFALVPDFQYIHIPGGLRGEHDCPVVTSRFVISY